MFSIVIPNLHSPLIDQVVHALERQTARNQIAEIIVVGQDRHGRVPVGVRFVETPRPISAAAARNLGASHASGDYVLFLDSDCLAAPDLVERVLERHREGHAVVGGGVAVERAVYWTMCDNLLVFAPFLAATPAGPRDYLPSLNFSIERKMFLEAGGFDTRFPGASGEDMELCLRLRRRGFTPFFEPRAIVAHRPARASAGAVWRHLRAFGRTTVGIRRDYGGGAAPRLNPRLSPLSGLIMALAPVLALWDVVGIYRAVPALRRYWRALPGMAWGKIAWYWGVAEALMLYREGPGSV
jgi:glycosyltransferase involved in cell wall biosynthesis